MKRKDLYSIKAGIEDCASLHNDESTEFVFRLIDIYDVVEKELLKYEKARPKRSEKYLEYLKEEMKLLHEYAIKDDKGMFVMMGKNIALSDGAAYSKELDALKLKNAEVIAEHKKGNDTFDVFLEEECELQFTKIPKKYIPSSISVGQYKEIRLIVE